MKDFPAFTRHAQFSPCGAFMVKCKTCGVSILITTAGPPDDPRSVKVACQETRGRALTGAAHVESGD